MCSYWVTYTVSSASFRQLPCMLWDHLKAKEVGMSFCVPLAAYYIRVSDLFQSDRDPSEGTTVAVRS